ncbi:hypothetical protein INT48_001880 [Thamnidium elegans]|uniref:Letm1 RBD domain-containing protein n=1 Tax=Thamnidium elegans TaxID=101142 RepID=A0A8H7SQW2_9FUNG|nr:hypothetical protein INT48_001880 [Thamnidium elegans]
MLRTLRFDQTVTRTCRLALNHHVATRRTLISSQRPLFVLRAEQSKGGYKQAKDLLKTIEEKQSIDKKKLEPIRPGTKTLWEKVKEEAVHYWHGTKLLGLELRRTTSDIVRVVPFAVFLIVPFMELLLPVALKLFPNMLPSTFENKKLEEEKRRKLVKVRLEMARFLQETIAESGAISDKSDTISTESAQEFANFFRKVRMTGDQPSTKDLLSIASKFEDELTLDNLSRPQLVSMCRYMNMNAFGTDNFLRFQLRNHMRHIKMDDKVIVSEGIDNLTIIELSHACVARGIRTLGNSPSRLREELKQWLDLHLEHQLPSTLLILSRAFSYTDNNMTPEDALRATFNSLPDNLVNEAELQVLETIGASTYKQKLDVLEQQQELIEDESEQEEKEEKARQAEEEEKSFTKKISARDISLKENEKDEDVSLSNEQRGDLQKALSNLRDKVDNLEQRSQLNEIKFHYEDYKDLIEELKVATHNESNSNTLRLGHRLEKMLEDIEKELEELENSSNTDNTTT